MGGSEVGWGRGCSVVVGGVWVKTNYGEQVLNPLLDNERAQLWPIPAHCSTYILDCIPDSETQHMYHRDVDSVHHHSVSDLRFLFSSWSTVLLCVGGELEQLISICKTNLQYQHV